LWKDIRVKLWVTALAALISLMPLAQAAHAGPALDDALQHHCGQSVCVIRDNGGGDVEVFQAAAKEVLHEGKHLVIDGYCASACVILADIARANTCITAQADMAVHKAFVVSLNAAKANGAVMGQAIWRQDPPQSADINAWVYAHGGYPTDGVRHIPVAAAKKFWPACR
jgi:hypothetical protein